MRTFTKLEAKFFALLLTVALILSVCIGISAKDTNAASLPSVLSADEQDGEDVGGEEDADEDESDWDEEDDEEDDSDEDSSDEDSEDEEDSDEDDESEPEDGDEITVGGLVYVVTFADSKSGEVAVIKPSKKTITKVTVPATIKWNNKITYKVTAIDKEAFKGCSKLKNITIAKNVKDIGVSAFKGCKALKTVKLGANVELIDASAFENCKALTAITLPSKVNELGKRAFCGCTKLKTITIKSSKLKTVGLNAIKNINKKATIKVPKKMLSKYRKLFTAKTGFKKSMKIK